MVPKVNGSLWVSRDRGVTPRRRNRTVETEGVPPGPEENIGTVNPCDVDPEHGQHF